MDECKRCKGEAWVCENHRDRPWNEKIDGGCECGAGANCPDCNASEGPHDPPRLPPGARTVFDKDGYRH